MPTLWESTFQISIAKDSPADTGNSGIGIGFELPSEIFRLNNNLNSLNSVEVEKIKRRLGVEIISRLKTVKVTKFQG